MCSLGTMQKLERNGERKADLSEKLSGGSPPVAGTMQLRFMECGGKPARRRYRLVHPHWPYSPNSDRNPDRPKLLPLLGERVGVRGKDATELNRSDVG